MNIIDKLKKLKIKKRYICILIGILFVGFISFSAAKKNHVEYETAEIQRRTITQVVETSGTINPVNTVSVGSTVSGLISAIYVDFNSKVTKGQLLAEIDPRTFQATVDQNAANVASARAELANKQAAYEMSAKTLRRYKNLYAKSFIPKSELDQAEADYKADIAQVNAARAKITQTQAQYNQSMVNLNYTKITAPVSGMIISREIDLGQPVAASFQAPELFTIAQDLEKMQIEVNVSEADIGEVKEGQDVTYTLDGYPNSEFYGKVTQVRISPTTVSNVVTYSVIVTVDNSDLKLKPGMTANVSIITAKNENVLAVPNIALKFTPKTDGTKYKSQGLWVKNGLKMERINITTGASDDSYTEVKGENVYEGEKILVGIKGGKKKSNNAPPPRM